MAASVRVKKHKVKVASESISLSSFSEVGDSMSSMLFDFDLARKKCGRMLNTALTFSSVINNVRDLRILTRPDSEFNSLCAQIDTFLRESSRKLYGTDQLPLDAENAPFREGLSQDDFKSVYETIREHPLIYKIIIACDNLDPYRVHIENREALSGRFLENMAGTSFTPFGDFNILDAYLQTPPDNITRKRYLLTCLHKMYVNGKNMYHEYVTPDLNVDHMINVVRDAITKLRTVPKLAECGLAFDTIENSIGLLRENFGQYYIDFTKSHSQSSIFESFITDVAKRQIGDDDEPQAPITDQRALHEQERRKRKRRMNQARLTRQFNKIVEFYQESARNSGQKNARADMLMRHYTSLSDRLKVKNLGRAPGSSDEQQDSSTPAQASASTAASASAPAPTPAQAPTLSESNPAPSASSS